MKKINVSVRGLCSIFEGGLHDGVVIVGVLPVQENPYTELLVVQMWSSEKARTCSNVYIYVEQRTDWQV